MAYLAAHEFIDQPYDLFGRQGLGDVEVVLERFAILEAAAVHLWVTDLAAV